MGSQNRDLNRQLFVLSATTRGQCPGRASSCQASVPTQGSLILTQDRQHSRIWGPEPKFSPLMGGHPGLPHPTMS